MLHKLKPALQTDNAFSKAAKNFFRGNGLSGTFTYSSPNFPGDIVDGARLFSAFTRTPSYYIKRNEEKILNETAPQILASIEYFNILVDLGCGNAFKAKIKNFIGNADYGPVDTNQDYLNDATEQCLELFPQKRVYPKQLNFFEDSINFPGKPFPMMLGSTITNFGTLTSVKNILKTAKRLSEQGNGSFIFTHDTNTNPVSLAQTYTHELHVLQTLNVLHRMKRDLDMINFDPEEFGFYGYWEESTSSFNLCMYPKKNMEFCVDDEWFSLKKDQILPQARLMKLPAEIMMALATEEGFNCHDPIYDDDGKIAIQHIYL